ncbi:uncharacterized protein [Dendropsophus ebraccatus]|uniref:uncharacterized protein isoform X2 n=1 Tax=Dendropsophus ebraccatus TaxID=150705 RepID=UPI00383214FA
MLKDCITPARLTVKELLLHCLPPCLPVVWSTCTTPPSRAILPGSSILGLAPGELQVHTTDHLTHGCSPPTETAAAATEERVIPGKRQRVPLYLQKPSCTPVTVTSSSHPAGGEERPIIAHCNFPFIFANNLFTSCTKEGRSDNLLWCSTTPNYDKDGHWIFCNTQVTTSTNNSNIPLVVTLCLGLALLCVCIVGCCMKFQWMGKSSDAVNSPDSIYENIDCKEVKTLHQCEM